MPQRKRDRRELFTDAFGKSGHSPDEKRNVRAEFQSERGKIVDTDVELPQLIQRNECRRRVRTAAAESAAGRNAFANFDVGAAFGIHEFSQQIRRANREIVRFGRAARKEHLSEYGGADKFAERFTRRIYRGDRFLSIRVERTWIAEFFQEIWLHRMQNA